MRHCSKPNCSGVAVSTLTYDYRNSTVVLGPLSTAAEPHSYDLCEHHAIGMTVPKGWDVVRLHINYEQAQQSEDDLMALVEAVRDAAEHGAPDLDDSVGTGFTAFGDGVDLALPVPAPRHGSNLTVVRGGQAAETETPGEHGGEGAASSPEPGPFRSPDGARKR